MTKHLIYLVSFFVFRRGFQEKKDLSWRNYLIWTVDRGRERNTPDTQNTLFIFFI